MSFEKPERLLTKEEWTILTEAALDNAGDYLTLSARVLQNKPRLASYYAKKANRIYDVLIALEIEYYQKHPDEDPDKKEDKGEQ